MLIFLANDQTEPTAGAGVDVESGVRVEVEIEHLRHRAPALGSTAWFVLVLAMCIVLVFMIFVIWISSVQSLVLTTVPPERKPV
jgi:hypothetical protein